ncbi:hypothetical protein PGTUg99_016746 [Puccinia graminis f. sp. tritici]|uniref:Uncharacterized protein n=1 Tax=Puccinia graminis f. sp. tritici TaxID=56615 RepID=A0A5B0S1T0_PUCGR|nr:hypothetical protein PGTUg99_016746 [Puccinia graminis f. sp. tritici]
MAYSEARTGAMAFRNAIPDLNLTKPFQCKSTDRPRRGLAAWHRSMTLSWLFLLVLIHGCDLALDVQYVLRYTERFVGSLGLGEKVKTSSHDVTVSWLALSMNLQDGRCAIKYKKLGGANATAPAQPLTHSPHQPNLQPRTGRLRRGTSELNIAE